jgi:hypothetical protein
MSDWPDAVIETGRRWSAWADSRDGPLPGPVANEWKALCDGCGVALTHVTEGREWRVLHDVHVTIVKPHEPVVGAQVAGHVLCQRAASCHVSRARCLESRLACPIAGRGGWREAYPYIRCSVIPASACGRLWQWLAHIPGLSAGNATSQTSPGRRSNESSHNGLPVAGFLLRDNTRT